MRTLVFCAALLPLAACGGLSIYGLEDLEQPPREASSFVSGEFLLVSLQVDPETDLDGDGVIDNNLPNALAAIEQVIPEDEWELGEFNARLDETLHTTTRILLDADHDGQRLDLDVVLETLGDADFEDRTTFGGVFTDERSFSAGPGDLRMPMLAYAEADPVDIQLWDTVITGVMDDGGSAGTMATVIPIAPLMDDVIAPMIPASGFDLNGDGVKESHDEVMDFLWAVAPLLGDVTFDDGQTGISAFLHWEAAPESDVPSL